MKNFLDVIEDIKMENANVIKAFNKDDGVGVRKMYEGKRSNPEYMKKLTEAVDFVAGIVEGKRPFHHFKEAMTTSDFPHLFGDILDRQLLAGYREYPTSYGALAKISTVSDFREVKRLAVDGGDGRLDTVGEKQHYKYGSVSDSKYAYSVKKYGRKFDFSFETMINDDLGALSDMPQRLGRAARRTEEYFVTNLFVSTTGPRGTFFSGGNKNVITSNPVLSVEALQTGMGILGAMVDAGGEPILVESVVLAVPPSLEIMARNILNATELRIASPASSATQMVTANWMRNRTELVILPYHPIIATTNGNTSWYLFANPSVSRPALEVGFLRGYTEPQVFMKAPNQALVGGGLASNFDGDFDSDNIEYKVRHIFGGALIDPKAAVASNGSGS